MAPKPRVLILDDSEIVLAVAKDGLEAHGFEVTVLDNPFELLPKMVERRPNCILIDIDMPALRGDAIVRLLHDHGMRQCPILLFSDRPEQELIEYARNCHADGFIPKTPDGEALARQVSAHLRS